MKQEYIIGAVFGAAAVAGILWVLKSSASKPTEAYVPRTRRRK